MPDTAKKPQANPKGSPESIPFFIKDFPGFSVKKRQQ
jgi:hypothetical protein